jgi:hypothetical protein
MRFAVGIHRESVLIFVAFVASLLMPCLSRCPLCLCGDGPLPVNRYRGAERDIVIENQGHFTGHADATVRCRIPR